MTVGGRNLAKRVNLLVVIVIAGLAFQILWEGWIWSLVALQPETHQPFDFSALYTAGRIAASNSYHLLYDIPTERQVQETIYGFSLRDDQLLLFNHPPILVPILQLICTPDYIASYWRWVLVSFGFVVCSAILMERIMSAMKWALGSRFLLLISAISFYPVFTGLLKGQDSAFLILGGMLWLFGMVLGKDWAAGLGLSMTIIRPQIALVLAVPFLFNRRKVWWWFAVGATLLALFSLGLVGVSGVKDFIHLVMISAGGQGYGLDEATMLNFTGMVVRLFPGIPISLLHDLAWAIFLVALAGLTVLWKISPMLRMRHIVLAACLSLFVSPHLYSHDLGFLLIPLFGLIFVAGYRGETNGKTVLPSTLNHPGTKIQIKPIHGVVFLLATSLLMLFAELWDPANFTVPYLLMAIIPLAAWRLERVPTNHEQWQF
jgi:hypothetical protein